MSNQQVTIQMAANLAVVVDKAREQFTDSLNMYLNNKGIKLDLADKSHIERLFSDFVYKYIVAEEAAFLSYLLYNELQNEGIVSQVVPDFLEKCETKLERIPESLVNKTSGLTGLAKRTLGDKKEMGPINSFLMNDIIAMSPLKHLRASFDAIILSFLGE